MTARYKLIFASIITLLLLTGCASAPTPVNTEAQESANVNAPTPDITSAPALILTQSQANDTDPLEIRSGNFSWNYKNDDETMTGGIACGPHPLDDEKLSHTAVLKLAQPDELNAVPYSFSCQIMPDKMTIHKWSRSDLGDTSAQELSTDTLEKDLPLVLELEAGYVYEFTATWEEEKLNENSFYGSASYVLVTE